MRLPIGKGSHANGGAAVSEDLRDVYIARVVPGKSFADVGGLWGTYGEKVSAASRAGAAKLTMLDILPRENDWWAKFEQRMQEMGIHGYDCVSADIHAAKLEPFDVVHSSGILYHLASPTTYLEKLRAIAREYVILTSAITPTFIYNRHGVLRVKDSGPLFVPALSEREKKIYTEFYARGDQNAVLGGVNADAVFWTGNYSAWWWLLPVVTIRRMCEVCGFEVVEDGPNWEGRAHTFLLRNTGREEMHAIG
jgi:hypothetical protein